jgi:large subunit ribosomal protein L20
MARVKRGTIAMKRRRNVLLHAKGFRWGNRSKERAARTTLLHAWSHAFKDRKRKKREFRQLWNIRINAGARANGITYSRLIEALKVKRIELNRKVLAEIAGTEPAMFAAIIREAQK